VKFVPALGVMRSLVLATWAVLLAPLLLLGALATPAGAQIMAVSVSQQELLEYHDEYAKCMVRYRHNEARKLVLSNTPNHRLEHDFRSIYTTNALLHVSGCPNLLIRDGRAFVLQPDMFRAALAHELIKADLKTAEANNFVDRAPLSHWMPPSQAMLDSQRAAQKNTKRRGKLEKVHAEDVGRAWLSRYGDCVAHGNSKASHEWVVSKAGTPTEQAAIATLQPVFAACLVEGEKLTFGKEVLRGAVAINYYRLAMADRVSANGAAR
jgi:hypothetical protein